MNFMNSFANPFVKLLARSSLHHLVDENVILITYTGRKSGQIKTVPVNYFQEEKIIHVISIRNRNWWRNLKGGAPVEVLLKGKKRSAWAVLVEDRKKVAEELHVLCKQNPKYAQNLNIRLNANDNPDSKDLLEAARKRVAVIIKLS